MINKDEHQNDIVFFLITWAKNDLIGVDKWFKFVGGREGVNNNKGEDIMVVIQRIMLPVDYWVCSHNIKYILL